MSFVQRYWCILMLGTLPITASVGAEEFPYNYCVVTLSDSVSQADVTGNFIIYNPLLSPYLERATIVCHPIACCPSAQQTYYGRSGLVDIPLHPWFFQLDDTIWLTDTPPVSVTSIDLALSQSVITTIGESASATVNAQLSDGTSVDMTPLTAGTTYSSSNPTIASVSDNGLVTAHAHGPIYLTARNEGRLAVQRLDVSPTAMFTDVLGVAYDPCGAPITGADVTTPFGGLSTTGIHGEFHIHDVLVPDAATVHATIQQELDGVDYQSTSLAVEPVPGGFTDTGLTEVCVPGTGLWVGSPMRAAVVYDDGSGPALYVAGDFRHAGGATVNRIAKWDGRYWYSLGSGLNGDVHAMVVFDDGTGPALYAGGAFTTAGDQAANHVAKWTNGQWSSLGVGTNGTVKGLAVWDDDGDGPNFPALYVGGEFTEAAGTSTSGVARWSGLEWSALGEGVAGYVNALHAYDEDGIGPTPAVLVAGGLFYTAGSVEVNHVAAWNGSSWQPVSGGLLEGEVYALESIQWEAEEDIWLYVGRTGSNTLSYYRPTALNWQPVFGEPNGSVRALYAGEEGGLATLFVGGGFTEAGYAPASRIARFRAPSEWSTFGDGMSGSVYALTQFDDGNGLQVYAGGAFGTAGAKTVRQVAKWDGVDWQALPQSSFRPPLYLDGREFAVYDDGSGSRLYLGGHGSSADDRLLRWEQTGWTAVGGLDGVAVSALEVFDDGSGPALYVGGAFWTANGTTVNCIAKWNGTAWSALGSGVDGTVSDIRAHDDGSGPAIFVAGTFNIAGGLPCNHVAKWDGTQWSCPGEGFDYAQYALEVYDDGEGPELYVAGLTTTPYRCIAKWDGTEWSPLGTGLINPNPSLKGVTLAVYNDGTGEGLYVGGEFGIAGGQVCNNVARWDGTAWHQVGDGIDGTVKALLAFDDGSGSALYASGEFESAGSVSANNIARWNGTAWTPLRSGTDSAVWALAGFDDGSGNALWATGEFTMAGGFGSDRVGAWRCLGCEE